MCTVAISTLENSTELLCIAVVAAVLVKTRTLLHTNELLKENINCPLNKPDEAFIKQKISPQTLNQQHGSKKGQTRYTDLPQLTKVYVVK